MKRDSAKCWTLLIGVNFLWTWIHKPITIWHHQRLFDMNKKQFEDLTTLVKFQTLYCSGTRSMRCESVLRTFFTDFSLFYFLCGYVQGFLLPLFFATWPPHKGLVYSCVYVVCTYICMYYALPPSLDHDQRLLWGNRNEIWTTPRRGIIPTILEYIPYLLA